ncbi:MAG: hypothetical protein AAFR70_00925 [Pseudomonadota bacterium]
MPDYDLGPEDAAIGAALSDGKRRRRRRGDDEDDEHDPGFSSRRSSFGLWMAILFVVGGSILMLAVLLTAS